MIVRNRDDAMTVEWGNGTSTRLLVEADGVGYTIAETTVRAGTSSLLEYRRHLESCYCLEGYGEIVDMDGTSHLLSPGVMYSLNEHDAHYLKADPATALRLISVFSPALRGDEKHNLDDAWSSAY